jgi:hypothetical protein
MAWVPKAEFGYHVMQHMHALHDDADAEKRDAAERAVPPIAGNQPTKRTGAINNPYRGSKDNRHLLNQVIASSKGGQSLLAPVASRVSTAASIFTPAINVGTSGISAVASSTSRVMAKGVNETLPAMLEASKEFANAAYVKATSGGDLVRSLARRQRGNFNHFFLQKAA